MKNKKIVYVISLFLIIFAMFLNIKDNSKQNLDPFSIEIGEIFKGIKYSENKYVLTYKLEDVDNDNQKDIIIIVGEKNNISDSEGKNLDLVVYSTLQKQYLNINFKKFEGKNARLDLVDLTGDNTLDIVVSVEKEFNTKNIRVVSFINNELKEIFREKENSYILFETEFLDGMKVKISNRKLNLDKELDISIFKNILIEDEIYDKSGRVLQENKNIIKNIGYIDFDFIRLSNYKGIRTKQRIILKNNENIIDEIDIIWKYEEGKWKLKEAKGIKLGNLLY